MKITKWNDAWKFWVNNGAFALVWNVPEEAREINLPHDAMIEKKANPNSLNGGNTGFRDGEIYDYVKFLYAPEEWKSQTIMLKFEGVYMNAFVHVNGQLAAKNPFGYTTFYVELNDYLKYGEENEIRVEVKAGAMINSRWYSGAGIYRDVYLLNSDLTYIVPEGVQIKTENADQEYAVLTVTTELKNRRTYPQEILLVTEIQDEKGNVAATEKTSAILFDQEIRKLSQRIIVETPKLWSDETPELYTCVTRVYMKDEEEILIDENQENFGIRTLQIDSKRGLRVNGRTVKLRGACIHHDSGLLGAATYEDAQYRQIKLMKEAGFNAIRMAHHPMAPAMLRACDALGMYVMDEAFDMWNHGKSDYDYSLYFQEWWEKDVTAMVRKDFNHPSVILYSVGNEIPEIGLAHGAKICHQLCTKIKSLDTTRFTLASVNGVFAAGDSVDKIMQDVLANANSSSADDAGEVNGSVNDFMTALDEHMDEIVVHDIISEKLEKACAATDIAGYNYMTARYEMDGEKYPNRIIVGSETYPPEIARNWKLVEQLPHVIGDFTWTGWDYIGEAGVGIPAYQWGEGGFGAVYPAQLAYPCDIDLTGFRRPASYFREIVFGLRKEPYIVAQDPHRYGQFLIKTPWVISDATANWTWEDCVGKPIVVEVYAPGDEVELFLNGKSLGKKASGKNAGFRVLFETVYKPGVLTAVVFENGQEISRSELQSVGKERSLWMEEETLSGIKEDGLMFLPIEIRDENDRLIYCDDQKLSLTVEGGAKAIGFGSGNPKPEYNFNEDVTKTFHGRALLILKKDKNVNKITVTIESEKGLKVSKTL